MPTAVGILFGSYLFCALIGSLFGLWGRICREKGPEITPARESTFLLSVGCAFFGYEVVVMTVEQCLPRARPARGLLSTAMF